MGPAESADYVVIGAGSAGCIVARRLAETGASVVLLEAGPVDKTRFVRKPGMIAVFHNVPQLKKKLDWGFYTVPQRHALNRRIPQTRGKVLGGSSSVNAMIYIRGQREDYDEWAAMGATGARFDLIAMDPRFVGRSTPVDVGCSPGVDQLLRDVPQLLERG